MYVGEVGKRLNLTLTMVGSYEFQKSFGWQTQTITIYTMHDEAGNVFVWKTSGLGLGIEGEDDRGDWTFDSVRKGDTFDCKATVKEHSEYKGTEQTVLTRVKVSKIDHIETEEEKIAKRAEAQRTSLGEGDFLWTMPYKQFKEHYSDCETVAGSYQCDRSTDGRATIQVIIRAGRLVPSGVRGKHYSGYEFLTDDGKRACYRAVSEENAKKQLLKDFPQGADWPCVKIYDYQRSQWF